MLPVKDSQRPVMQCDSSSSSSSGTESPRDGTALALPTSFSDLDARNEENRLQSPGSQVLQTSNQIEITGGEFVGGHFGPQTTYQHFNLEKLEQSQHIHHHHHYPPGSSQQETSISEEPVGATGYTAQQQAVTGEPSISSEEVALCPFIKLFPKRPISDNVFRGEQTSKLTGTRELAIKFLRYKEEKLREAKILTKLHPHHNVISIIHSDIYKLGVVEHIYIAMELCHEQNLQDYVSQNRSMPFNPQISISQAKQLIEGLNHIHSNNIIHRDLKPHNILFSLDKKTIKIADFGISKEMTSGRTVTNVTNARAGTDGYRAPETYNSNEISKQTDIFTLGLVFYFLWSNGHHAFGEDPDDWNSNIKRNRDRDLSHLLLPDKETAIDLLEWMLRVNPRERPTVSQILKHQMFGGIERALGTTATSPGATATTPTSPGATATAPTSPVPITTSARKVPGPFHSTNEQAVPSTTQGLIHCRLEERQRGGNPSISNAAGNTEEMEFLAEKSQHHMKNKEYSLASEALQNLLENQTDPSIRFETIQQIAECHVMCKVPLHKDIKKLFSTYDSSPWPLKSIENIADDHFEHSRSVRAYFLYICASKWYKTHSSPSDAVEAIERCIKKLRKLVEKEEPVGSRSILSNYVQSGINEILKDQASCYLDLGCAFNKVKEYEKAHDKLLQGYDLMRNHFKEDVVKHKLYGHILKNLMVSVASIEENLAYEECNQALEVFGKAEDYQEEDERIKDIENTMLEYYN